MPCFGHRHSFDRLLQRESQAAAARGGAQIYDPLRALIERLDASKAGMEQRLAHAVAAESAHAGRPVRLAPFLLIPDKVWRGRHGQFLLHALGLCPYDPWNVAFAPADPESAATMGVSMPPDPDGEERLEHCNDTLTAARASYGVSFEIEEWTADHHDVEAACEAARQDVRALALLLRKDYAHPEAHVLTAAPHAPGGH